MFSLAAAVAVFILQARVTAEDGESPSLVGMVYFPAKISLSTEKVREGDQFAAIAEFKLGEGADLYKDATYFKWTELKGVKEVRVDYPKGIMVPDAEHEGQQTVAFTGEFAIKQVFQVTGKAGEQVVVKGVLHDRGCVGNSCYMPETQAVEFPAMTIEELPAGAQATVIEAPAESGTGVAAPEKEEGGIFKGGKFRWFDLCLAFGFGVLISFTPCVLPMTPITSGIILSYSKPGRLSAFFSSLIYVFGIAVVFGILGAIMGMVGGAAQTAFNSIYVRGIVAAIFLALALSMFGLYEIKVPGSITTKAQALGGKTRKNLAGLFLLGMISAFVLSPCVAGPTAFILIWIATTGDYLLGFLMMFLMAWGMGLLLIAAGTFTSLVPRSGPWMDKVKVIFGMVMLWGALYFIWPYVSNQVFLFGIGGVCISGSILLGCWKKIAEGGGTLGWRLAGVFLVLAALFLILCGALIYLGTDLLGVEGARVFTPGSTKEVEQALAEHKVVVVDYWATWCLSCKELDKTVFKDARIREEMKRFAAIRVDLSESSKEKEALMKKHKVPALPRIVIFDSKGEEVYNLSEDDFGKSADRLLEILKKVK